MNWFKLKDLEKSLANNNVSNKEGFYYLLANWIVFEFISSAVVKYHHDNPGVMTMLIVIPVIGLTIVFKTNQKRDNKNFLKRIISLHWVIGIRFVFLIILVVILDDFFIASIQNEIIKGWLLGSLVAAIVSGFYYFLARSIKKVSKSIR